MKGSKDLRLAVSRIGTNFFRSEVCISQVLCPSTVFRNRQKARYNLNLFQTACGSVCVRAGSRCCRFITQSLGRGNQRPFYLCSTFPFAARAEDHFFLPAAFVFGPHFAPKKPAPSFFRGGSWPALRTNERKQYSIRMAIAVRPEVACERDARCSPGGRMLCRLWLQPRPHGTPASPPGTHRRRRRRCPYSLCFL